MTNEQIKEFALNNGFKLKEQADGKMDLNAYVYEFARALLESKPVLKPLEWERFGDEQFTKTLMGTYRIKPNPKPTKSNPYVVFYGGREPKGVSSIDEAKKWAFEHHEEKMREWLNYE